MILKALYDYYQAMAELKKDEVAQFGMDWVTISFVIIINEDGTLKQELSYDAWGRLRNPDTQQVYAVGEEPELFLGRGYTGHEHLPWFGLINMNARLYDPILGRFLSPDPYVQMPDFTQNFNRYSYCLNNPLKHTDKDGKPQQQEVFKGKIIYISKLKE